MLGCFVINLLNNKTIILLNLAEYRLVLADSAYGLVSYKVSDDIPRDFAHVDICPLIVSVEEKQSAQEFQLLIPFLQLTWKETKLVLMSVATVTLKGLCHWLFYHVYARFNCEKKINGTVIK